MLRKPNRKSLVYRLGYKAGMHIPLAILGIAIAFLIFGAINTISIILTNSP